MSRCIATTVAAFFNNAPRDRRGTTPGVEELADTGPPGRMVASTSNGGTDLIAVGDETDVGGADGATDEVDELTDWSEHGLGLYLSPLTDERGRPLRDKKKRRIWVGDAWRWVLRDALGQDPAQLAWADLPAVTRFTISSPAILGWFRGRDEGLPRDDRMRPGGFGLLAHPAEEDLAGRMPAGPFETTPERWEKQDWYDRRSHRQVRITTADPVTAPERFAAELASGALRVRTLGDVLATYGQRPEHKSLAPDGSPAGPTTVGLLRRRPVRSRPARTHLAGKEGNKLLERVTGVVTDQEAYRTDFGTRVDPWATLVVPVLRRMGASEVVQRTSRTWRRAIERVIKDGHRPKSGGRVAALTGVATEFAREHVGAGTDMDDTAALAACLALPDVSEVRLCACGCGHPTRSAHARWHSDAHRKQASRRAQR